MISRVPLGSSVIRACAVSLTLSSGSQFSHSIFVCVHVSPFSVVVSIVRILASSDISSMSTTLSWIVWGCVAAAVFFVLSPLCIPRWSIQVV